MEVSRIHFALYYALLTVVLSSCGGGANQNPTDSPSPTGPVAPANVSIDTTALEPDTTEFSESASAPGLGMAIPDTQVLTEVDEIVSTTIDSAVDVGNPGSEPAPSANIEPVIEILDGILITLTEQHGSNLLYANAYFSEDTRTVYPGTAEIESSARPIDYCTGSASRNFETPTRLNIPEQPNINYSNIFKSRRVDVGDSVYLETGGLPYATLKKIVTENTTTPVYYGLTPRYDTESLSYVDNAYPRPSGSLTLRLNDPTRFDVTDIIIPEVPRVVVEYPLLGDPMVIGNRLLWTKNDDPNSRMHLTAWYSGDRNHFHLICDFEDDGEFLIPVEYAAFFEEITQFPNWSLARFWNSFTQDNDRRVSIFLSSTE